MRIHYSEKEAAGKAIINACTELQGSDSVPLGQYRGFSMSLQYDAAHTGNKLTMKGAMSHTISLGADIFGNITRMDNLVDGLAKELAGYQSELQDTRTQLANSRTEMETPFAKELCQGIRAGEEVRTAEGTEYPSEYGSEGYCTVGR